jgi:3-hydroxyisobutyrate dehydrogenase-like beta-hydroxyacid dehydrogenase
MSSSRPSASTTAQASAKPPTSSVDQPVRGNLAPSAVRAIGMIGVGMMGHGIALNLLRHGYRVTLLEHAGNQPLDRLIAQGARSEGDLRALAVACDVLILCVTGSPQVEDALTRSGGLLEGLQPGTVVIDCSTAIPSSTERLAGLVERAGGSFLDAAMTRTPREAEEGRLNLLVGGDAELLARCQPLLASFAENITHAGAIGAGHRMKLVHNYVSLGFVALLAEAAACATAAGIDSSILLQVLQQGGGNGTALERLRPYLESGDPSGLRFSLANARKDLGYYTDMATEGNAVTVIAEGVRRTFADAAASAGEQRLVPELVSILGKRTVTPDA